MSGINTKEFANWLLKFDKDRDVTTACEVDGKTYLSTAYTWDSGKNWALKPLFKDAIDTGVVKEEDTNYFQLFSVAGTPDSIAFNAPRLINDQNPYVDGRAAVFRLSNFCKKYLKKIVKVIKYSHRNADVV